MTTAQKLEDARQRLVELKGALADVDRRLWGLDQQVEAAALFRGQAALMQVLNRSDGSEFNDIARAAGERAAMQDGLKLARSSIEAQAQAEERLIRILHDVSLAEKNLEGDEEIVAAGVALAEALSAAAEAGEVLRAAGAGTAFFEEAITTAGLGRVLEQVEIKIACRTVPSRVVEETADIGAGATRTIKRIETPPRRDAAKLARDTLIAPRHLRLEDAKRNAAEALAEVNRLMRRYEPAVPASGRVA